MANVGYKEIKGKRGIFGYLFLLIFIGFNLLMLASIFLGLGGATEGYESMSAAEQTGTAIGTGIGVMMLMIIWAVGDIVLCIPVFLTRPSKTLVPVEV